MEFLSQPWPWYIGGPLLGLSVPAVLLLTGKQLGIAMIFKTACSTSRTIRDRIAFFNYDWKVDSWRFFFLGGVTLGGFIGGVILANPNPMIVSPATIADLREIGMTQLMSGSVDFNGLLPASLFSFEHAMTLPGFLFLLSGGFLVGFGARYADGCTSGHAIMGLAYFQFASLVAVIGFFLGGLIMVFLILPQILRWIL